MKSPLLALLLLSACATAPPEPERPPVTQPAAALKLDPFYAKSLDAGGIPITASARVPDEALYRARDIVMTMLSRRPDLRRALIARKQRVGVMAPDEMTTDLPEQRDWKKPQIDDVRLTYCERQAWAKVSTLSDRDYWNTRARGMGGAYATVGAENLMGTTGTAWYGENLLTHEFGHVVLDAIWAADRPLYGEIWDAYRHAQATGLWKGSYVMNDMAEYWAEGSQFWFDDDMAYRRAPSLVVLNHADLERYDPDLWRALEKVYPASHRIASDAFWMSPARMNSALVPEDGHEVC